MADFPKYASLDITTIVSSLLKLGYVPH